MTGILATHCGRSVAEVALWVITEGTEVGADSDERRTPYNDTMKRGMSVGDHVQNDTNWISASEAKAEKKEIQEKVTQRTHKALTQDVDGITV